MKNWPRWRNLTWATASQSQRIQPYVCVCVCVCVCIYIYIYIERERETKINIFKEMCPGLWSLRVAECRRLRFSVCLAWCSTLHPAHKFQSNGADRHASRRPNTHAAPISITWFPIRGQWDCSPCSCLGRLQTRLWEQFSKLNTNPRFTCAFISEL
jgi:hypothetical protein